MMILHCFCPTFSQVKALHLVKQLATEDPSLNVPDGLQRKPNPWISQNLRGCQAENQFEQFSTVKEDHGDFGMVHGDFGMVPLYMIVSQVLHCEVRKGLR